MHRNVRALLVALVMSALPAALFAQQAPFTGPLLAGGKNGDNPKHPLGARQYGLRQRALEAKLKGKAKGKVVEVAKGQYIQLDLEGTDRVFVILAEFGDEINTVTGGSPGPRHNEIAEPNRAVDNSTIWQADYSSDHYRRLYFSSAPGADSVVNYYLAQSSGRYTIEGAVAEWVRVRFNEARYGTNLCGGSVCSTVWDLVREAINVWTADRLAEGQTLAQIESYLDTFDVWDRYDYDQDGDFNEPDGYIDHFQIVHAGEGEETGGGAQGPNAIWSHRWYAYFNLIGSAGPSFNRLGGTQFGNTGIWVGDYTIQPENGGLGVFAHEYGHDLGLPDLYDTSSTGESSSAFWSLMASGSYLGDGSLDLGARPGDLGAWEKFQLGWLKYEVSSAGVRSSHRIGPAERTTKAAQGLFTVLPDRVRTLVLGTPPEGALAWWSGRGDNLDNTMTHTVTVPAAPASLSMQLWYDIERDWDYGYVAVSSDGGQTWANLASSVTTTTNPNGQNFGNGITGTSNGWVAAAFDLSAYAGQTVLLRLRYWTDGFVQGKGLMADQIVLGSFADGAEGGTGGWTLNGFAASDGTETSTHFNAYLAEFRQYRDFDAGLETGPYNFSFLATPDLVQHFPYQDGLLISYWDTSMPDNDVGLHPGEGEILPIDSHPVPLIRGDGNPWRTRVQVYDAPFSLQPTDPVSLFYTNFSEQYPASLFPSLPAVPAFNDRLDWWSPAKPDSSVKVPKTGTVVEIAGYNTLGNFMQVNVGPAK